MHDNAWSSTIIYIYVCVCVCVSISFRTHFDHVPQDLRVVVVVQLLHNR